MKFVPDKIAYIGIMLAKIAGPEFECIHKPLADTLPYRWEFFTRAEPVQHVVTIEFTKDDILRMTVEGESGKLDHLHARFAHLFTFGAAA